MRINKLHQLGILFLWLCLTVMGILYLTDYSNQSGKAAQIKTDWPLTTQIKPEIEKPTLLLFAHPQCPCTRASIGELARIMARRRGLMKAYVLFSNPTDMPDKWVKSDIWQSASEIPDVIAIADKDAVEAKQFGARTSGQVFLYDQKGTLVFQGGITSSRGHAGDNKGRQAIESFIDAGTLPSMQKTPVFGCALWAESVR